MSCLGFAIFLVVTAATRACELKQNVKQVSFESSDECFLQYSGECQPGQGEIESKKCLSDADGGISCCARQCHNDETCHGFAWRENDFGCYGTGSCQLKNIRCDEKDQLVQTPGTYWFSSELRRRLSSQWAYTRCISAENVALLPADPTEQPPQTPPRTTPPRTTPTPKPDDEGDDTGFKIGLLLPRHPRS